MGQEYFYRENRQDRAEEEILLTERLAEGCGETRWRIRPRHSAAFCFPPVRFSPDVAFPGF